MGDTMAAALMGPPPGPMSGRAAMSYPEGLGCWGVGEVRPGRVWSLESVLALGWERHSSGLSQLRVGCQEGKGGRAFSPATFLPWALAG